jgi:heme oxygenase
MRFTVSLRQLLKEATAKRHEQAENHQFQGALANGKLPFAMYRRYMVQLTHLHRVFEGDLDSERNSSVLKSVVVSEHYQLPFLLNDLNALGLDEHSEPPLPCLEATSWREHVHTQPERLLGYLYVLLGSKHGGKFIAHKVKEAYGLSKAGYSYFNPYGESFRPLWQNFTLALNNLNLSCNHDPADEEKLRKNVVAGAESMFDLFMQIGDGILKTEPSLSSTDN